MNKEIEKLERAIQAAIIACEDETGLEVSSLSRSFSRDAVVVTLIRKVETEKAPPPPIGFEDCRDAAGIPCGDCLVCNAPF